MSEPIHQRIAQILESRPDQLKPGDPLGDYLLLEKLGEGGFGHVWRAEHTIHGRVAALKIFVPRGFSPAERHAAAERFVEGVTAMQKLSAEPRVIDLFEGPMVSNGYLLFAMRYDVRVAPS